LLYVTRVGYIMLCIACANNASTPNKTDLCTTRTKKQIDSLPEYAQRIYKKHTIMQSNNTKILIKDVVVRAKVLKKLPKVSWAAVKKDIERKELRLKKNNSISDNRAGT